MPRQDHGHDLFRIVYASRALIADPGAFGALVKDVVAVSASNNARLQITGLLLAHNGWFLQAIEGPRRNISNRFGVIARDLRHNQVELISGESAGERVFGRWSMCARALTPAAGPVLATMDMGTGLDPSRLSSGRALALLRAIADLPERQSATGPEGIIRPLNRALES